MTSRRVAVAATSDAGVLQIDLSRTTSNKHLNQMGQRHDSYYKGIRFILNWLIILNGRKPFFNVAPVHLAVLVVLFTGINNFPILVLIRRIEKTRLCELQTLARASMINARHDNQRHWYHID